MVRIGCSGWNYRDWRGPVYPEGVPAARWLELYAERFDTVEVNATFYRLPALETVERWASKTPRGFLFAVKVSRYLTHVRRLRGVPEALATLEERLAPLAAAGKLGPLLWQLPSTFPRDDARLEAALSGTGSGRHAFEFRHESWFAPDVYRLLERYGAALVIGDDPARPFQTLELVANWTYLRFHRGRGVRGSYSPRELEQWAERIRSWMPETDVYAYFNDDWEAFAVANATRLRELVA